MNGLDNQSPYIKERYVEFLGLCIPLFLEYHHTPAKQVCEILRHYNNKIIEINTKKK